MPKERIEKLKFMVDAFLDVIKVIAVILFVSAGLALTAPGVSMDINRPW